MTKEIELTVSEFNGFLNALRCVLGYRRVFGCYLLDVKPGYIEEHIQHLSGKGEVLQKRYAVNYETVKTLFNEHIFDPLRSVGLSDLENVDWNIIEYYGLASTSINENGPWNPVVSGESLLLEFESAESTKVLELIVEIEKYAIVTFLEAAIEDSQGELVSRERNDR